MTVTRKKALSGKSTDIQARYDRIAPFYDLWDFLPEFIYYRLWRCQLWVGIQSGRILEIGVGTGKNVRCYPAGTQVTAVDISSGMLKRAARRAAAREDVSIELMQMDVNDLALENNTYDVVAGSFILTVLDDPLGALGEFKRVTGPGGELRLLEFVRSENRLTAFWQDLLTPLTHAIYGARLNRDLTTLIRQSGYEIVSADAMGGGSVMRYHAVLPASKG